MPNYKVKFEHISVGLFLQVVTIELSTFLGYSGNYHDISVTRNILKLSFVNPDRVTGYSVEKDILGQFTEIFVAEVQVRKSRACCTGHSTQHDYRIDQNRLTFYRSIPVVL